MPNALLLPHLGYVTAENYSIFYTQMLENLDACVNGKPTRIIEWIKNKIQTNHKRDINNPKIIIADEPTANLDEKLSLHFIEILRELKGLGKTIIIATHDPLFFDLDFVDREIQIHNGKIILWSLHLKF